MAITRAQIARELYIKGGVVNPDGRRGFGGGADMGTVGTDGKQGGKGSNQDLSGGYQGGPLGGYGDAGRDDKPSKEVRDREKQKYQKQFGGVDPTGSRPRGIFDRINTFNTNFQRQKLLDLVKKRSLQKYQDIEQYVDVMDDYGLTAEEIADKVAADPSYGYDFSGLEKGKDKLGSNIGTSLEKYRPNLYDVNSTLKGRFAIGNLLTDAIRPDTQVTALNTLNKARAYTDLVNTSSSMTNQELRDAMTDLQNRGKTDDQINPKDDGDGIQDPCKGPNPPAYCFTGIRSAAPEEKKEEDDEIINYRLMADGGRAALAEGGMPYEGGIMDLESSRQMYGLGKLVKKVTRSVKKIAKSPIGKAAIGAALFKFGGGSGIMKSLFGVKARNQALLGKEGFLGSLGLTKGFGSYMPTALGGIAASTLGSYFLTPKEEDEDETLYAGADIADPSYIMNNPELFTNRRLAAEGGRINYAGGTVPSFRDYLTKQGLNLDKLDANIFSIMQRAYDRDYPDRPNKLAEGGKPEPVAKKTMPLLDMDGQEMDLRAEGGFVPIGRMEKADDVPARLSKNEFVFTADAVRNAGEGDVDKGAEVMYNMMKNLESGGDVSEESQGLEGARDMFKTSQRLEEVL